MTDGRMDERTHGWIVPHGTLNMGYRIVLTQNNVNFAFFNRL